MVGGEGVAASPSIAGDSSFPPSFSASSSSTPLPVSQPSLQVIGSSTPAAAVTPTASMSAQFGDSQQNPQLQVLSPQPANMTGAQSLQQQTGVLLQQNQQQSTNPGQVNYQPPSTPGQQHLGQKQQQGSLPRPQQQQHGQYVQNQQFASSAQSPSSMQGAQPLARPSLSSSPALSQRPLQLSQTGVRSGGPTSQQQMMMPQTGIRTQTMISSQQQQRALQAGQATQQTQHHPSLQTAQMAASQNQALHQQFSSSARPLYSQAEQSFGVQYPYHFQQTQQIGNTLSRTGMVGQASGHPSILSPQASQQLSGMQSQMQARQKQGQAQNAQLQTSSASGQSMQGPQTVGIMGLPAVGGQLMRPTAPLAQQQQQQQRMQQSSLRPLQQQQHAILQQPSRTSPQVQQLTRVSSVGSQVPSLSPSSQSVTTASSMLHHQQPWMQKQAQPLSSIQHPTQGQLQVRQVLSQHPQQIQAQQQQLHNQTQNSQLQQASRVQHSIVQRPPTPSGGALVSGIPTSFAGASNQTPELGTRILGKRSIQELVGQVDPNVRLDTDVEDILLDIADDFIESVTTFACKLAKHRKSNVLEAKDILLHLSKNWDITIPGFGNDELRTYKRSLIDETHKQRIALIRKSAASQKIGQDLGAGKGSGGLPATGIAVPDAPADA